eukprot:11584014-Heterocapsa_arctica.AAC.1
MSTSTPAPSSSLASRCPSPSSSPTLSPSVPLVRPPPGLEALAPVPVLPTARRAVERRTARPDRG